MKHTTENQIKSPSSLSLPLSRRPLVVKNRQIKAIQIPHVNSSLLVLLCCCFLFVTPFIDWSSFTIIVSLRVRIHASFSYVKHKLVTLGSNTFDFFLLVLPLISIITARVSTRSFLYLNQRGKGSWIGRRVTALLAVLSNKRSILIHSFCTSIARWL